MNGPKMFRYRIVIGDLSDNKVAGRTGEVNQRVNKNSVKKMNEYQAAATDLQDLRSHFLLRMLLISHEHSTRAVSLFPSTKRQIRGQINKMAENWAFYMKKEFNNETVIL